MKTFQLRNMLLLGTFVIGVLAALAYMLAVSWMIRQQHLDQSQAALRKASANIADNLAERRSKLLAAAHQLTTQRNLGATIWYLAQYAHSDLDRETLFNTYLQLAREARQAGSAAAASRIAIYDAAGHLIAFALFDGASEQAGFIERHPQLRFQSATLAPGSDIVAAGLRTGTIPPRINAELGGMLPQHEDASYTVVNGTLAIETSVPIMDEAFDQGSSKAEIRQVGLVVIDQALDRVFVNQLARLTDTEINVFTGEQLGSGSLADYRHPLRQGIAESAQGTAASLLLNEITIAGAGYYQALLPIRNGRTPIGSIATLRSKAAVEHNIWEMQRILWLIAAAGLVLVVPLSWYFATLIAAPLTTLSRILRGAAHEGRTATLEEELALLERKKLRYSEAGDLTQSFIAMNDAVKQKIRQINEINASLEHTVNERTAALIAKEQESRTLIENSPDTIARYDADCRRIYVNPAFCHLAGYAPQELLGKRPTEVPGGPNIAQYEEKIRAVLSSGVNQQFELRWVVRGGHEACSHVRLTAEVDLNGKVISVLAVGRDISDRMEFEAMIWKQANFDALTKLPNRQMFHDRLEHEALVANRCGRPMVLMLIDLDRFKEINDSLGHDKGDVLLIDAARRIASCVRESDTVARLGGDEFTVILSGVDDTDSVGRIAQAIIDKLAEPFTLGSEEAYISASIGITLYPNHASDLDMLFKHADQAMYVAKSAGRNRFCYFTPDLQEAAQRRLRLTSDLRSALAGQQLLVYYQPIVELATGKVYKAEALVRWQHPERGMISPAEFIGLAEETGLIVPIGDWVFQQAAQQARQWRSRFVPAFQISINKSPVQIRHEEVNVAQWPAYLRQQGMPGQSIAIEITEGLLLNAEPQINQKLLAFRDAGIQVAIDDFGTGYSSLAYLKRFDIDYLKIDRSFVNNLADDADNQALCEAIIVMAHKLGLKVIAEGVETAAQRDLLAAAGCDFAQGYLYSRPVPAAQFEQWAWPAAAPGAVSGTADQAGLTR
ncbi:MAG: EAL domain-containing protein [Chitinivorax sp.]